MLTARDIILRYGFNSTAYQILNPGIEHLVFPHTPAVVGFVRQPRWWVVAGAPVCPKDQLPHTVAAFERYAQSHDARVCYMCAASRLANATQNSISHSRITIGAEPIWNPQTWPDVVAANPTIRAQLRRAKNKGVAITALANPTANDLHHLHALLSDWLTHRPMPPLGFLVEPNALRAGVQDRLLLIATIPGSPKPIAYLLASPIPQRHGYLVEQIIRHPSAPNGTAELLIDTAMQHLAQHHCHHVSLGLVALAKNAAPHMNQNPLWLKLLFSFARTHARHLYHFDGPEAFRTKLAPSHWEPVYAITNEPAFSPASLYAIANAFTHNRPWSTLTAALARSARHL